MFDEFVAKVNELRSRDELFAIATVFRFEPPVSGKPGDKAIVHEVWG